MAAEALAARHRQRPRIDARLRELDFGFWEGARWDDIPPAAIAAWTRALLGRAGPGGESGAGMIARVRDFARRLRAMPGHHIVVAHGGSLLVLRALLEHRPIRLAGKRLGYGEACDIP